MSSSINKEQYRKMVAYAYGFGVSSVILNLIFYYKNMLYQFIPFNILNRMIEDFAIKHYNLFGNTIILKTLGVILIMIGGFGTYGTKDPDLKKESIIRSLVIGLILMYLSSLFISNKSIIIFQIIDIIAVITGMCFFIYACSSFRKLIYNNEEDFFNKNREAFPQQRAKVTNKVSVNIPYRFWYKNKWNDGWINLVNPMQGILVAGKPGSGKSFGILIPCIHTLIKRDFTGLVYDFKYPTLAFDAINALIEHAHTREDKTLPLPKLAFFDISNPLKSCRINPISPDYIDDMIDASESAVMIFKGLTTGNDKVADFFTQSGKNILSAIILFLRDVEINQKERLQKQYEKKGEIVPQEALDAFEFCTIPHVLEMFCLPFALMFNLLNTNLRVQFIVKSFMNALEGGAAEMLNGQVATSMMKLSPIVSDSMYYLFSKNEVNLRVNLNKNPTLLIIGNNPERQEIYRAFISLIVGRIMKLVNSQKRRNCMLVIDEFPTITLDGIDNLMNTGRSVGIATILGFQVKSQIVNAYGEIGSENILTSAGSVLIGKTEGKYADEMSNKIGKSNQKKTEFTYSEGVSIADRENFYNMVPVDTLANLSTGEMVGTLTDDFKSELKYKRFHGFIDADHPDFPKSQEFYTAKIIEGEKDVKQEIPDDFFPDAPKSKKEMEQIFTDNSYKIKNDISLIIDLEVKRIKEENNFHQMMALVTLEAELIKDEHQKYVL
jgi:hypothetical protein